MTKREQTRLSDLTEALCTGAEALDQLSQELRSVEILENLDLNNGHLRLLSKKLWTEYRRINTLLTEVAAK